MSERNLQKSVVAYLRAALAPYRGVVVCIPNAPPSKRNPITGQTVGEPDLLVLVRGQAIGIELKDRAGEVKKHQRARHAAWREAGAEVFVVRDLETVEGIVAALRAGRVREEGV